MSRIVRPIRVEGNTAFIPMARGLEAIIDTTHVHLVEGFNWVPQSYRGHNYAYRSRTDADGGGSANVLLHRHIFNPPINLFVDHINGNGLDNRSSNIRFATNSQNQMNSKLSARNTTGLKGVTWDKRRCKFRAGITKNGVFKHLGYYDFDKDAHNAYSVASAEIHGSFGRTV